MPLTSFSLSNSISEIVGAVRSQSPLVHCITNYVTVNDCANALLGVGASPVMAHCIQETADMAAIASAVVINMGTPDESSLLAMLNAARSANTHNIPVVFDPVGVAATPFRRHLAKALLECANIAIIRGNLSELAALADDNAEGMRGVDSKCDSTTGLPSDIARRVAKRYSCVAAITGATDYVSDGENLVTLRNGHPILCRLTGTGCMASALCAACAGATPDDLLLAAATGISIISIAGEIAAHSLKPDQGTGSFRIALMDAISTATPDSIRGYIKASI